MQKLKDYIICFNCHKIESKTKAETDSWSSIPAGFGEAMGKKVELQVYLCDTCTPQGIIKNVNTVKRPMLAIN